MRYAPADHIHEFTATNVPMDYAEYDSNMSYPKEARVWVVRDGSYAQDEYGPTDVYESLQADNLGNNPKEAATFWAKVGPTNRWAMRDPYSGAVTFLDGDIVTSIQTGGAPYNVATRIIGVGFCVGKSVTLEILNWDDPNADDSYDSLACVHHFSDLVDASGKGKDLTLNEAFLSTGNKKFGDMSLRLGGNSSASMAASADLSPGAGDFCVEFFATFDAIEAEEVMYEQGDPAIGQFMSIRKNIDNSISLFASDTDSATGLTVNLTSADTYEAGTWYAIRASRSGDTWRLFVDGAMKGTTDWAGTLDLSAAPVFLGAKSDGTKSMLGYIDELRITIGDSRGTGTSYVVTTEEYNSDPIDLPSAVTIPLNNELFAQNEQLWYSIYSKYQKERMQTVFIDLGTTVYNAEIQITIEKGDSWKAACGAIGYSGASVPEAISMWGVTVGMTDYSRKEVNDYGVVEFVRRPYAPTVSVVMEVPKELVDEVVPTLAWLRARPVFWDFNNVDATGVYSTFSSLMIIGAYNDFEMKMVDYEHYEISMTVEGMI